MNNLEQSGEAPRNPEVNMEKMRSIISRAPELIEDEMNRGTGNPWFACVDTQLQSLMFLVGFAQKDGELDIERAEILTEKIRTLSEETRELQRKYPTRDDEVPEELKQSIYQKINILE